MVKKKMERDFDSPEAFDDFMSDTPIEEEAEAIDESEEEEELTPLPEELDESEEEDAEEDIPLPEMEEEEDKSREDMLDIAADVPVQVVAVMGKRNVTIKEIALLKMGEVVELNRPANEIVDLVAGGKLIAKGELVEIEGKLGVRIIKMLK